MKLVKFDTMWNEYNKVIFVNPAHVSHLGQYQDCLDTVTTRMVVGGEVFFVRLSVEQVIAKLSVV